MSATYRAGMYSVTFQWKEIVIYSEGECTFWFPAGWGVDPPVLYIPSEDLWEHVTPPWMHGRRHVSSSACVQIRNTCSRSRILHLSTVVMTSNSGGTS